MSVEGRLTIDLTRAADGTGHARITSSRPLGITRLLVGGPPDDVVKTIPLLFNVCGVAQGATAAHACERALGIGTDAEAHKVRRLLVLVEMLREHLARAVVDWERFLGLASQSEGMLRVMRLCALTRRTLDPGGDALTIGARPARGHQPIGPMLTEAERLVEVLVFGEPLADWRARRTASDLRDWSGKRCTPAQQLVCKVIESDWADAGSADIDFLPDLPEAVLSTKLFGEHHGSFVAAPTWNDSPRETSALSRQAENPIVADVSRVHGAGLLARLVGRVVEIGEALRMMSDLAEAGHCEHQQLPQDTPKGQGIAHVEAARGRLVHGVEIADAVVQHYAILAPTEWNFHADGGAARGLGDIAGRGGDVHALASLFVSAVDPCVGYELRVH